MSNTAAEDLTPDKYDAYYEAVMASVKGRWFLAEFAKRNRAADTIEILGAVERLKSRISEYREEGRIEVLRAELQEMASAIKQTRGEIAAIKADQTQIDRFSSATGELEEITAATEQATSDILEAVESIQTLAESLRTDPSYAELTAKLEEYITNIFLACSFQDITGQRTTKVVSVLRFIEQRVNSMIEIWGITNKDNVEDLARAENDKRPDAHLMSGPAQRGGGINQSAIDAVMLGHADVRQGGSTEPKADRKVSAAATEGDDEATGQVLPEIDQNAIDKLFD